MTRRHAFARRPTAQRGSTLIEILVTLVILMFGLLGLVGISGRASMAELESFQRIQAMQVVQDMANRLNANRKVASCYSNAANGVTLGAGANAKSAVPACTLGNTQEQTQAVADLLHLARLEGLDACTIGQTAQIHFVVEIEKARIP